MKKNLLSLITFILCVDAYAQKTTSTYLQSRLSSAISNRQAQLIKPSETYIAPLNDVSPLSSIRTPLPNQPESVIRTSVPPRPESVIRTSVPPSPESVIRTHPFSNQSRINSVPVVIDQTTYDLQANYGTPGQRIFLWSDNTISAIWNFSSSFITNPPDRKTGYAYFDGVAWLPPYTIGSFRTGFPSLGCSDQLGEVIVNHGSNALLGAPCTTNTNKMSRQTKGIGPWLESPLTCNSVIWWPRVAVGGNNGTTISVCGNDNAGGPINFSRSTDGGATWVDDNITLPNLMSVLYEAPLDAYQLVSRGDVIAFVTGGWFESLILWKSVDNGATWTITDVNSFPLAPYAYDAAGAITDINNDGIADTILTTDSGIALAIDYNNIVHVAAGLNRVLDEDPTAGSPGIGYFPGTDGLCYWNESMGPNTIISNVVASIEDINNDGQITTPAGIGGMYQCSLTGMPVLAIDSSNYIHLAYSSIVENTTNNNPANEQAYRNIYYMNSIDGGVTFSTPFRLAPDDFNEQVWLSMAANVNSFIHIIYHQDDEPGNSYQEADPITITDVMYLGYANPVAVTEINTSILETTVYPNPVKNVLYVDFKMKQPELLKIQLVDILGKTVYTSTLQTKAGVNNFKLNVNGFASGIYSLNTQFDNQLISEKVVIE